MKRKAFACVRRALGILAMVASVTIPTLAGPPLICWPIDIGPAQSLPWPANGQSVTGRPDYDVNRLVADTLALLDPGTAVIVRMETLRRATIYAQRDSNAARELLLQLESRGDKNQSDALAVFDLGYLIECYKQAELARSQGLGAWRGTQWRNPAPGEDGYALVKKAIALRGDNAEMEFAAALITMETSDDAHQQHVRRAMAGAKADGLLAQNIAARFAK